MIKLKLLYNKMIQEVGDLKKIQPYKYNKLSDRRYSFEIGEDVVIIIFTKYDNEDLQGLKLEGDVWNLGYLYNGDDTQYKTESFSLLMKIMKTVFDVSVDFTNSKPEIKNITLFGTNKVKDLKQLKTDQQKSNLYINVFIQNRSQLNGDWWYKDISLDDDFKGYLIYNKK
jgi:hypothetical protein